MKYIDREEIVEKKLKKNGKDNSIYDNAKSRLEKLKLLIFYFPNTEIHDIELASKIYQRVTGNGISPLNGEYFDNTKLLLLSRKSGNDGRNKGSGVPFKINNSNGESNSTFSNGNNSKGSGNNLNSHSSKSENNSKGSSSSSKSNSFNNGNHSSGSSLNKSENTFKGNNGHIKKGNSLADDEKNKDESNEKLSENNGSSGNGGSGEGCESGEVGNENSSSNDGSGGHEFSNDKENKDIKKRMIDFASNVFDKKKIATKPMWKIDHLSENIQEMYKFKKQRSNNPIIKIQNVNRNNAKRTNYSIRTFAILATTANGKKHIMEISSNGHIIIRENIKYEPFYQKKNSSLFYIGNQEWRAEEKSFRLNSKKLDIQVASEYLKDCFKEEKKKNQNIANFILGSSEPNQKNITECSIEKMKNHEKISYAKCINNAAKTCTFKSIPLGPFSTPLSIDRTMAPCMKQEIDVCNK